MPINLRNVSVSMPLLVLLLSIVAGESVPTAFGQNTPPNITSSDIVDLFGNVTDREEGGRGEDDDDGGNNNDNSNFEISTSSESATINLPPDAIIEAGETYVIELEEQILSNNVDSLVLTNAAGNIQDRTSSLIDRIDDDRTWQRVPDGNNEWQFVEGTEGNSNGDSDTLSTILDSIYSGSEVVECLGSADCIEGVATRIVDGDTLYVRANGTVYKVDLALSDAPSRTEEMFVESTAFTRDLCLGSTVLVDQDDMLLTSNSGVIGVVYC